MRTPEGRASVRVPGFAALLVLALLLGVATRPEGGVVALAWPAAGVSVWWLLSCRSRTETVVATGLVVVAAMATNALTGVATPAAVGFGAGNAAHAVVGLLALRRLVPGAAGLRSPGDVVRVLLAAVLASAASATVAAAISAVTLPEEAPPTFAMVLVRNAGSTFVLVAAVLALRGDGGGGPRSRPRLGELLPAGAGAVLLHLGVFQAALAGAPVLFLGMLVPVWFGTRLGVRATAVAGAVLSVLTVCLTLLGAGLAAVVDVHVRAVVVQAYIVVLTLVGLSLATLQRASDDMRARLEDSRRELQEAADAAVIGKAVVVRGADGGWRLTRPNPALVRLLGRDPSEMRWRELLFPHDSLVVRAALDRIADGLDESWSGEVRHCLPGGGALWTQLHVSRMPSGAGPGSSAVVAQVLDITERRAAQEELSRLALHDSLTGLPNRGRLRARLDEMLADATPTSRVVVLFVDLDGFKAVNDGHGHEVGDAVLQAVAAALRAALRPEDEVGRLGGDEFVACCPGVTGPQEAGALVRRVAATLSPALLVRGRDVGLGVSVGWTLSGPADDSSALLRRSDEAMYDAKRAGGRQVAADPSLGPSDEGAPHEPVRVPAPR